jgi:hypothetical protein
MKLIYKKLNILLLFILVSHISFAHEGMWLPHLLKQIEGTMKEMGMKMSAEDIYSVNQGSLKDAIAHFGGGCTSSIISSQGLLLTNHHCGYGQIQSHSSVENNLLRNGFWAATQKDELPNPGLTATFIRRIEDVTEAALTGVNSNMTEAERQSTIDKNLNALGAQIVKKKDEDHFFRAFYYGNQYLLFITVTYRDVRLVGTPPESIGKFGSDTDNWVWPRHTGDFALFRVYAGSDNQPADYHETNQPYRPSKHLNVSMDGVEAEDFTLVFGFPGRTQQYIPAAGVAMNLNAINPPRIAIRDTTLQILNKAMRADEATRIQYASKYARIANAWKKWIGENLGLAQTNAVGKKKSMEMEFQERVSGHPRYENLLPDMNRLYEEITPLAVASEYYNEIVLRNIEILTPARLMATLAARFNDNGEKGYQDYLTRITPYLEGFHKNYNSDLDQQVFTSLFQIYAEQGNPVYTHPLVRENFTRQHAHANTEMFFQNSMFNDFTSFLDFIKGDPTEVVEIISKDTLVNFYLTLQDHYTETVARPLQLIQDDLDKMMREYMAAQQEVMKEKTFYPDANSTLRVTFGKVEGYQPEGKPRYEYQTWLSGVVEKYIPDDYEFDVPPRLLELQKNKDFGPYGVDGKMPVCFIGSNHTTGGNSGSPAIDAYGNLIGLNFDRVWEGTMSDLNFDPSICRNIMVDARYILFIIDKYANARHIVDEMTLVFPKTK